MSTVFDIAIYRMPGEKRISRVNCTPEELEYSKKLGEYIGKYGSRAIEVMEAEQRGETTLSEDKTKAPGYISDIMEPTRHMATGEMYDSKSAFRAKTKELGLVEIGNETKYLRKKNVDKRMDKRSRVEDIKRAIYQLRNSR